MIKIIALTNNDELISVKTIEEINEDELKWFWVDFEKPNEMEIAYLYDYFNFHPLAIEDCLQWMQRPKVDFYDGYSFFVLHAIQRETLVHMEINLFLGNKYIVTFHQDPNLPEFIEASKNLLESGIDLWEEGNTYVAYLIMDLIVDGYFPGVFNIEDKLKEYDDIMNMSYDKDQIKTLYKTRSDLMKVGRTVTSTRDLIYRILNTTHTNRFMGGKAYFADIYDHLLKISEIIDANREIASEIRDSMISLNTNKMNSVMTLLTVITTIFIPLTFIAGIYGMNFKNMPEIDHPYGYFIVLGIMILIGFLMYRWFKKKGWFDF
ncbi:magnesium/cobalt transporter CorA [Alkalibacter mobilis]|uniref:magnesium/cobalt transporter CorA n=1 Tax=Alkalibacter mobilis TaxID=2787712 RepID=UPI00189CF7E5|nr:magnesium/cobalt transporter CorA [Alkalibacter mobilis]MBF7096354.1 magnesium/cobalt transporter CorA [Alkalibacter mobilis]